ncbi:MAG: cytoplasmic protein [Pseudomonadota bacterium]|nr:cytoplasmic protein [Pseudomonadota bacterium]
MSANEAGQMPEFTVDTNHLYREETITDLKVASIKILTPINLDGSEDKSRAQIYIGNTQLMSPEGPVPLQASLEANNLEEAITVFPDAMRQSLAEMVEKIKEMQQQQKQKEVDSSRIIIPGR